MISILMATHNPIDKYFKKCLDSIYNQTYDNFEIVLIDDGSNIDVMEIIKKNKYDVSKIKFIKLESNVGLPKALNIGLEQCKGEYIARMDDDDIMESTRLEKMVSHVKSNNLDGCFSWYERIDKNDKSLFIHKINIPKDQYLKQLLCKGNIFCHSTFFVKTKVLKSVNGYDENLRYAQDSDLYIRLLDDYKFDVIQESLLKSRVNDYRNNSYRETLSLTYALFGAVNHFTDKNKKSYKGKLTLIVRLIRYYIGITRIQKNNK